MIYDDPFWTIPSCISKVFCGLIVPGGLVIMGKVVNTKHEESFENAIESKFVTKQRLNLNDLLQRRKEQKQIEKKTNLYIVSGVAAVGAVVVAVLSL